MFAFRVDRGSGGTKTNQTGVPMESKQPHRTTHHAGLRQLKRRSERATHSEDCVDRLSINAVIASVHVALFWLPTATRLLHLLVQDRQTNRFPWISKDGRDGTTMEIHSQAFP